MLDDPKRPGDDPDDEDEDDVPQGGEQYQLRAVADLRLGSGETAQFTTGTCTVGGVSAE